MASLVLSGCGSTQIVERPVGPPTAFLGKTTVDLPVGRTNADLARTAVLYREALESCNADKAIIAEWAKDIQEGK